MKKVFATTLGIACSVLLFSGCVVRTYPVNKDRVDQDLNVGNRGYLMGRPPADETIERRATRPTRVVEIELHSPLKFERGRRPAKKVSLPDQVPGEVTPVDEQVAPELTSDLSAQSYVKYTVKKGDTLQKISNKFFGTTKKWMKIFEANKGVLKTPNSIYPGKTIVIPVEKTPETKEKIK
ncbi:MAG: LysM peptidoglycan-binding domain-containing protein [Candidatus Omnitrophota bacterium]|jgi:LysM repeat protein